MQVVLSQRMSLPYQASPLSLYVPLRRSPSPYMFYFEHGRISRGRRLARDPGAAGKAAWSRCVRLPVPVRAAPAGAGCRLERELLADPKERAEHVMLMDPGATMSAGWPQVGSVRVDGEHDHRGVIRT